jgi:hypothetical protein
VRVAVRNNTKSTRVSDFFLPELPDHEAEAPGASSAAAPVNSRMIATVQEAGLDPKGGQVDWGQCYSIMTVPHEGGLPQCCWREEH